MSDVPDTRRSVVFTSEVAYESERINAAAVYCSDGRFGEQCDDFLHNALKLPRYDRMIVPGGAACLVGHEAVHLEEGGVVEQLKFLIEAHELRQIVLIAHEDCAYYRQRLKVADDEFETRQREDLATAARRLRGMASVITVECFMLRVDGQTVYFERVEV